MFLSRLILDPLNRRARRALSFPYEMHRLVLLGFPPEHRGGGCRVLFRIEPEGGAREARVLVQSDREPDWAARRGEGLEVVSQYETKRLELSLAGGRQYRFRLRANPTRRISQTRKRIGVVKEAEQIAWLERKGVGGGFSLDHTTVQVVPEGLVRCTRSMDKDVVCHSVRFEGVIAVTDPTSLMSTIHAGIGSGKAFGFGLLSLARAES